MSRSEYIAYSVLALVLIGGGFWLGYLDHRKRRPAEPDPGPILPPPPDEWPTMPMEHLAAYAEQLLREGELKAEARLRAQMGRGPIYPLSRYRGGRQDPQHGMNRPNALRPVDPPSADEPTPPIPRPAERHAGYYPERDS